MPEQPAFEIRVDPRLLAEFRAAAKKNFPKETYGVFLGHLDEPGVVEIEEILICPREQTVKSTQWVIIPDENWLREVEKRAKNDDLAVVGDIHSHCSTDENGFSCETAPSEGDWAAVPRYQYLFSGTYTFMAIMALHRAAVKIRSKVNFWPLLPAFRLTWKDSD